jgi:SAM-dependent methyltransferase
MVSAVMNARNRALYDALIGFLPTSSGGRVLDVGCGNGLVLGLLAEKLASGAGTSGTSNVPGASYHFSGIDLSRDIIAAARRRNRKAIAGGSMDFSCQDVADLGFPDATFTSAFTINTVYFWPDLSRPLHEIHRVLEPGGHFLNVLYTNAELATHPHTRTGYAFYEPDELLDTTAQVGFKCKIIPLLDGRAYSVFATKV